MTLISARINTGFHIASDRPRGGQNKHSLTQLDMDIDIRLAHVEDLNRIIELQTEAIAILCPKDYQPEQVEALVTGQAQYRGAHETIFLAEHQGDLVGFSALSTFSNQITAVYVHPKFARQGVGTKLLAELEGTAIAKGHKRLWVLSSLTGIPFYNSQGYEFKRQAGFWSETQVWIPCAHLEKCLVPLTELEKQQKEMLTTIGLLFTLFLTIGLIKLLAS